MTKNQVLRKIRTIQNRIEKNGSIKAYHDYELEKYVLQTPRTEVEIGNLTGTWFTNSLTTSLVSEVTLVYSAYDGVISIQPTNNNESYFEFSSGLNHEDHPNIYTDAVWVLWNHLKCL